MPVLYVALNGTLNLENVTVANGSGPRGGGIENRGTVNVINSTFSGDRATENGGGAIFNTGALSVTNSTFSGNRATQNSGGAIFNTGALSVARSSFINNSVTNIYGGGGIASNAYLYVVNSTFSGNLANVGGGVFSSDGTLSVVNSTFSGNSARAGGGIYFGGPTDEAILKDTIIADSAGGIGALQTPSSALLRGRTFCVSAEYFV